MSSVKSINISRSEFQKACNLYNASQNKKGGDEAKIRNMYKEEQDELAKRQEDLYREMQKLEQQYNTSVVNTYSRNPREIEDSRERINRRINVINNQIEEVEGQLEASRETLGYELDALNSEYFKFATSSINKELNI